MIKNVFSFVLAALMAFTLEVVAEVPNIAGVWKGPNDLQITLEVNPRTGAVKVLDCGIYRVTGWSSTATLSGNTLTIKGESDFYPGSAYGISGKFTIEPGGWQISGTLKMGAPDNDFYFNGHTTLSKDGQFDAKAQLNAMGGAVYEYDGKEDGLELGFTVGPLAHAEVKAWAQDVVEFDCEYSLNGYNVKILTNNPYIPEDGDGFYMGTFSKDMKTLTIHNYSDGMYGPSSVTLKRVN